MKLFPLKGLGFFVCVPGVAFAQALHNPLLFSYTGLNAYSNKIDVFSSQANTAALSRISSFAAGVYAEKRFLLDELSFFDAALAIPTSSGNFGFNAIHYGFSAYNESQLGLAYGRHLGAKADVGVQFDYYDVHIAQYGNASTVSFEIGALFHLTENLNAGMYVYNPVGGKLGKYNEEKLASRYAAGFGYMPSDKFFAGLEIVKQENMPVDVNVGIQYRVLTRFVATGGVAAGASMMYLGLGLEWGSARLDAVASYHPQLGITPGLLLVYSLNNKTD